MGYNLHIGEAKISYEQPEELDENGVSLECDTFEDEEAPDLGKGDVSGKTSCRYPSYCTFHGWAKDVGLLDVFYQDNGDGTFGEMRGGHPGAIAITPKMYNRVKEALDKWRAEHPDGIMPTPENTKDIPEWHEPGYTKEAWEKFDYMLGRLVWFEFWFRYALKNCKQPVLVNS